MPFEITVHEQSLEENVTGASIKGDLAAAVKAANARAAYEQVLADKDPTGWSSAEQEHAAAGVKAALELVHALGGAHDHFRVTIIQGDDHLNVSVQRLDGATDTTGADS